MKTLIDFLKAHKIVICGIIIAICEWVMGVSTLTGMVTAIIGFLAPSSVAGQGRAARVVRAAQAGQAGQATEPPAELRRAEAPGATRPGEQTQELARQVGEKIRAMMEQRRAGR